MRQMGATRSFSVIPDEVTMKVQPGQVNDLYPKMAVRRTRSRNPQTGTGPAGWLSDRSIIAGQPEGRSPTAGLATGLRDEALSQLSRS